MLTKAQNKALRFLVRWGRAWPGRFSLRTLGALVDRGLVASYFSSNFGGSRYYELTQAGRDFCKSHKPIS